MHPDRSTTRRPAAAEAAMLTRERNHAHSAPAFIMKFGRGPLPLDHPDATINDLIFSRMIDPQWSALQRAFVDKVTAKEEAQRRCPGLLVPDTLAVVAIETVRSLGHLHDLLRPFIGAQAIAKPAHASGAAVFLDAIVSPADLQGLHDLAQADYGVAMREMQYSDLPRRIIVERLVPAIGGAPPDDLKFHCVHGEPLLCQVDHARFGTPWSRVFRVPGFTPMYADDGLVPPNDHRMPDPDRLLALTAAARALAAPFDYVRVDLYDGADGIYFGELTFTPAAALGIAPSADGCHRETPTHREYSRTLMTAFRRGPDGVR